MDIIVWFLPMAGDDAPEKTMASAVTAEGTLALSALTFSAVPVFVVQVQNTPTEFIEGLIEGIVACLYIDGMLQELKPDTKKAN